MGKILGPFRNIIIKIMTKLKTIFYAFVQS